MTRVTVAYLAKAKFGGWPSFTMHLCAALRAAGMAPVIRTLAARTAEMPRKFGYGLMCRRMAFADLCGLRDPIIIAAADKDHADAARALIAKGALLVVHDPAEKHLAGMPADRCVVIRQAMLRHMAAATFIPHPYQRAYDSEGDPPALRDSPVCQARIDWDKHTDLILEAADLWGQIRLLGASNPMYVFHRIKPRWPDFKVQPFPPDQHGGAALCRTASATIDMSAIKGDGGGTQYSFMEAWDAGSPLIISRKWTEGFPDDEMRHGVNCLVAGSGGEIRDHLAAIHTNPEKSARLVKAGVLSLERHEPARVGAQYASALLR